MIPYGKVYLTELDRRNAETIRMWLNEPEIHRFLLVGHIPITREQEERYYDEQSVASDSYGFEIHVATDGRYVGNIGLQGVDLRHRHGEIGVVIGDRASWGQGFGGDAIVACLTFAFQTLGLHRVSIRTHEEHTRAQELYKRLGFVETGRERQHIFQEGHFQDEIILDMLEQEFRALYCSNA
jgi:[ribosomal protein S5]-alanine N-acetyltransferase